jgi:hypothetical protein
MDRFRVLADSSARPGAAQGEDVASATLFQRAFDDAATAGS